MLLSLFLRCLGGLLYAAEDQFATLKVGSETYTTVTVTMVTKTAIYFTHSRGIGTAKLNDLDPAMQEHFHFNPAEAAAKQAEQAQGNALYAKALRETPPAKPLPHAASPEPTASDEIGRAHV